MDLSKYADLFVTESREHLSALNDALLELERSPAATEPVGEIFRAVHTVKGMSATMGYRAVSELAHEMETLLDALRRQALTATPAVIDALFAAADALEEGIAQSVRNEGDTIVVAPMVERLRAVAATKAAPTRKRSESKQKKASRKASPRSAEPSAPSTSRGAPRTVRVELAPDCALRGARALVVLARVGSIGTVESADPTSDDMQSDRFDGMFTIRLTSSESADRIEAVIRSAGDVAVVQVDGESTVPDVADSLLSSPASSKAEPQTASTRATHVRIALRRLDTLMNLIGELVIARGRLAQIASAIGEQALDETVAQTSRLIGDVQDEIMRSRMVPVGQVFDRFPRLVRDAARSLRKEIAFAIDGKEIELDRSMLEEIGDPVMHLLRNALDHGIEPPDARVAVGKSREGRLALSILRERSTVVVRVSDDGRGIDRERVLRKAIDLGLVAATTSSLSDDELVRLIGRPGFSTAEQVTDLSGRGVGIDVVNTRVRALGGSVDIRSVAGAGTTVTVRLPVTLAIVRALLARVADETYAVPLTHVSETVELSRGARRQLRGRDVLVIRDDVLPLIEFRELLNLPAGDANEAQHQVIVLETGERRAGLVVDELTGQQEIVVKSFDPVRDGLSLFSGATILADGAPALIVDVGSLL